MTLVQVIHGDCLSIMPTLGVEIIDAIVTDPPYGLSFMGKAWDHGVPGIPFWKAAFRVLKPGAHLVAFGGTRTYHRLACAIEDAGFQIRDTILWLYGSGFPKSHNLDPFCRIEKRQEFSGFGTALKPACEPIVLARKPLVGTVAANVTEYGTGAINIDACRIEGGESTVRANGPIWYQGGGSGGVGGSDIGRWPANVLHDGSDEVMAAFAAFGSDKGQAAALGATGRARPTKHAFGDMAPPVPCAPRDAQGTAARFFYSAKADADDRAWSKHPTVKPVSLMRWLTRLVTPPGGHILDPFAGSGTTGEAARLEGFKATLIEKEAQYVADINRRLGRARGDDTPLFASVETAG